MRNILMLILLGIMLLAGCSKPGNTAGQPPQNNQVTAPNDSTSSPTPKTSTDEKSKSDSSVSNENQATPGDLEKLTKKLDETTDQKEREKVLADIQKILDQAEKNAPKQ